MASCNQFWLKLVHVIMVCIIDVLALGSKFQNSNEAVEMTKMMGKVSHTVNKRFEKDQKDL